MKGAAGMVPIAVTASAVAGRLVFGLPLWEEAFG